MLKMELGQRWKLLRVSGSWIYLDSSSSEMEHSSYGIGLVQAKPRCVVVQRLPMNQRAVSWLANPGEGGMPAKVRAVEGPRNGPLPR